MRIYFMVPAYRGLTCLPMVEALDDTMKLCRERGHETFLGKKEGDPYIQVVRNDLIKWFRESGCDVGVFWDDDVSLDPADVLRLIEMPEDMVSVIPPYKTEREDYPVVVRCDDDGIPISRADGCISGAFVPTGMLVFKRSVIERMCEAYPERKYFKRHNGQVLEGYVDLFPQGLRDGQWVGEDYAFCRLWTDLGGEIWVVPDVNVSHHGKDRAGKPRAFKGNYERFLRRQPGGSDAPKFELRKAGDIGGFLSIHEGAWLAEEAAKRKVIVEIGSFYGRSTRAIADNTGGTVFAVDDWKGPREMRALKTPDEVYSEFTKNLEEHIASGKVVVVRCDHADTATLDAIPDPDMVFIDGDHAPESVARDIEYWLGRINPGGLICGHDDDWSPVNGVVSQMLPHAEHIPGTVIWAYEVPVQDFPGRQYEVDIEFTKDELLQPLDSGMVINAATS